MVRNALKEAIMAATNNIQRLYKFSAEVNHPGEKGTFRELFVAQLLHPLLPQQYGIGSGVVIDDWGRQSKQSDIIIYDRRLLPPILMAEGRGLFPIDSVLAIVEVKSKLAARDYIDIVEAAKFFYPYDKEHLHIATPGKLSKSGTKYPLYTIFAYTSDAASTFSSLYENASKSIPSTI